MAMTVQNFGVAMRGLIDKQFAAYVILSFFWLLLFSFLAQVFVCANCFVIIRYCVVFVVDKATKGCLQTKVTQILTRGNRDPDTHQR